MSQLLLFFLLKASLRLICALRSLYFAGSWLTKYCKGKLCLRKTGVQDPSFVCYRDSGFLNLSLVFKAEGGKFVDLLIAMDKICTDVRRESKQTLA